MLRKTLLTAATFLGLALPLGLTSTAQAHPPGVVYVPTTIRYYPPPVVTYYSPPVVTYYSPPVVITLPRYEVLYRRYSHWHVYATYSSRHEAYRAARHLEIDGFEVLVEAR